MAKGNIGVIGGSGVYGIEGINLVKEHQIETPFGMPSDVVSEFELDGATFFFVPRHGKTHGILPSEINYRANIYALKQLGVDYLVSVSAVGSLKEEMPPGDFVLVDQFIDWTKGSRDRSFFGKGVIGHVSNANPVNEELRQTILNSSKTVDGAKIHDGGTYICIEGPQFSTRAESHLYRSFGASVIGMTNVPEAFLAKEAGIAYATVAMVTDYDGWKDEHCTIDEIMKVMKANGANAQNLVKKVIVDLNQNKFDFVKENQFGIMTPKESMDADQRSMVDLFLS